MSIIGFKATGSNSLDILFDESKGSVKISSPLLASARVIIPDKTALPIHCAN